MHHHRKGSLAVAVDFVCGVQVVRQQVGIAGGDMRIVFELNGGADIARDIHADHPLKQDLAI